MSERNRERLLALGAEVIVEALEGFPEACTLSRAIRDASGAARDMELVWMNERARLGQPDPAATLGRTCSEVWPKMVENGSFVACMRVLDTGVEERGEFDWKDAATHAASFYEWSARRIGPDLLLWVLRDASERMARTLESEVRVNTVLETVPDAIIVIDERGTMTSANAATERMLGWPAAELVGKNVRVLMDEPDASRHDGYLSAYRETGERKIIGIGRDVRARHRDGRALPVRLAVGEARVGGKRFFTGILHDLTEREQLEEQLRHARKLELVGRLAGSLAHDFNNLLTIITATSSWLQETVPEQRANAAISEISEAAERAGAITRQLLALSRRDIEPPRAVDPDALVRKVGKMARRLAKPHVDVVVEERAGGWWLVVDALSLEQALLNLVMNALDAMPSGGTLRLRSARVERAEDGDVPRGEWVELAVVDTGTGLEPAVRARMFDPFFTTKPPEQGTGLGLVVVRDFTDRSRGHVLVSSEVGKGSTFRLVFPRAEAVAVVATQAAREPRSSARGGTILLVDDERAIRTATARALAARGFTVTSAADAAEAVREFERLGGAVDVLVADVSLAGKSGPELAEELRAKNPTMGVLYMSGFTPETVLAKKLPRADAFLSKPFTLEELTKKVRELAEGSRRV